MRRPAKSTWVLVLAMIVALGAIYLVKQKLDSSTHRADYSIAGSKQRIAIRLTPLTSGLGKYERTLVLTMPGGQELDFSQCQDSGGYSRAQLYQASDGSYIVRGYFDTTRLSANFEKLEYTQSASTGDGTYLGAFDFNSDGRWSFMGPESSPESPLTPRGG